MATPSSLRDMRDDTNLGLLLRQIRDGLLSRIQKRLVSNGIAINYSQFLVVKILAQTGPQMPGELARRLDHNAGAMTRLIDRLVDDGYAQRKPHAVDRRAQMIELTTKGQSLWRTISHYIEQAQGLALRELKGRDSAKLFTLLRTVRDTLDNADD